ncbi:MAG: hypothetical protein QY332_06205 [Anaerolineales bacterium]|nr:MAG: hypothetical protein QY332_06205 [Anaerolineales bacterium]
MQQPEKHPYSMQDERLADFTDHVLAGNVEKTASSLDDELFHLKETVLRLSRATPPAPLEDASVKQMYVRLKARVRREELLEKPSVWKKWFGREFPQKLGLAFAVLVVLVVLVVSTPSITPSGSSTTGAASNPVNYFIAVGLAGMLLVIFWIIRRK